ncbi:hypothetical protein [Psychrosphaera algicola]|uniref:Uncharacterized protein n=1 Tax=Psychrosphaera algicola TaxID=3023714 RepID=A0ABT5FD80_9GAMM|nr:hypothetical protein [Psychrosphaera sp. G1-22]MDC2889331.1 hypothetical protein [Psychrosphaera sp. G1-22]
MDDTGLGTQQGKLITDFGEGKISKAEYVEGMDAITDGGLTGSSLVIPGGGAVKVAKWLKTLAAGGTLSKTALTAIRQSYVNEVRGIKGAAEAMLKGGMSVKNVVIAAHGMRRAIGQKYKNLTPFILRQLIYIRNVTPRWLKGAGYDSKLGPTFKWYRKRGDTYRDIISSSSKPSKAMNKWAGVK